MFSLQSNFVKTHVGKNVGTLSRFLGNIRALENNECSTHDVWTTFMEVFFPPQSLRISSHVPLKESQTSLK